MMNRQSLNGLPLGSHYGQAPVRSGTRLFLSCLTRWWHSGGSASRTLVWGQTHAHYVVGIPLRRLALPRPRPPGMAEMSNIASAARSALTRLLVVCVRA